MSTGNFTNYLRDVLLDEVFGGQDYTPPVSLYVGLSTTTPTDEGTNFTEPDSADAYARVEVDNDLTTWVASDDGFKENDIDFEFPEATGSWGEVTHFAIFDGAEGTGENMLAWGELAIAKTIDEGDIATFRSGDVEITLSACVENS